MMLHKPARDARVKLFGIQVDAISMETAVQRIYGWMTQATGNCKYVVTPNVDHVVRLREHQSFRLAYRDAALVVADGLPLVLASRWLGKPVPERVAGSDLIPELFAAADQHGPIKVFLLGAAPGVAGRAAERIESTWPAVHVTGFNSPPLGFENQEHLNQSILDHIRRAKPDLLVLGLGAPKQELWVHAHRNRIDAGVAVCAGGTIDFLAGEKQRAPRWARKAGLEWCHRLLSEPRRLARRYAGNAWTFPRLLWQEWRRS
ncbi:MAG: WecB/TagA/CpsF family glycosyltransferase [Planctomycetota bacterium]